MLQKYRYIKFLQNFVRTNKLQVAFAGQYQFKKHTPFYYPDRKAEMKRIEENQKTQLVANQPDPDENRKLPKDYYYKVLGIKKFATAQEIKTAYYELAKRYHPDAHQTSQHESKRFQEISNAYHILSDENKRFEYDHLGRINNEKEFLQQAKNALKSTDFKSAFFKSKTREELLNMHSTEPPLELSFVEAARGVKKHIEMRCPKPCPTCLGKSLKLVYQRKPEPCKKCAGTGSITKKTATFTSVSICDQCSGKRFVQPGTCNMCDNRGVVIETVRVPVTVPPGIKTGDPLVVEKPNTNERITYRVRVKPSDYYERKGNHVHSVRYISISEAVFGGTFKIRGIYDDLVIKLEPGTESHTEVVVKGKGIKAAREQTGNHVITFKVRIPKQVSIKQRQLLEALSKTEETSFQHRVDW